MLSASESPWLCICRLMCVIQCAKFGPNDVIDGHECGCVIISFIYRPLNCLQLYNGAGTVLCCQRVRTHERTNEIRKMIWNKRVNMNRHFWIGHMWTTRIFFLQNVQQDRQCPWSSFSLWMNYSNSIFTAFIALLLLRLYCI